MTWIEHLTRQIARSLLMMLLLLMAFAATLAHAADKPLYVPGAVTADATLPTQTVSGDAYRAYIPVYLRSTAIRAVSVDALLLGPDGGIVPVAVKQRTGSGGTMVAGQSIPISPNAVLGLDLSAKLAITGDYVLSVRIMGPDGTTLLAVGGKVQRASPALPADGIVSDPPVTLFSGMDRLAVDLPLTGLGDRDLSFTVSAVRTVKSIGSGEVGVCRSGNPWHYVLKRGTAGKLRVTFCDREGAGDYHAKFDLVGDGGGVRHVNVEIKYADGWYCFIFMLLLGSLVGAPLAWWRASGRDQANSLLALDTLRTDVTTMAAKLGTAARSARLVPLLDAIEQCRAEAVTDGRSASVIAQLTTLTNRRDFLNRVLWEASRAAELASRPEVEAAIDEALDQVAGGTAEQTAAAIDALDAAVKAARAASLKAAAMGVANDAGAIDPPDFHLFTGRENRRALLRRRGLYDIAATIALFALFCLTAVTVLWLPNPVWGSPADYIVAFIAGVAAFGGLAGQLGTFRTTVAGFKAG